MSSVRETSSNQLDNEKIEVDTDSPCSELLDQLQVPLFLPSESLPPSHRSTRSSP